MLPVNKLPPFRILLHDSGQAQEEYIPEERSILDERHAASWYIVACLAILF